MITLVLSLLLFIDIAAQEETSMPVTARPVQQQKSNNIIRLHNILGKFNSFEIFRGHSADLCDAIESTDVRRLANRLFSMFLIDNKFRIKITGLDITYKQPEMMVYFRKFYTK